MLIRQFFALITILSFTLTQALPAWALRPGQEAQTRASGLEEQLRSGAAVSLAAPSGTIPGFGTFHDDQGVLGTEKSARRTSRVITEADSGFLRETAEYLQGLEPEQKNLRDQVLLGADYLRTKASYLTEWLPSGEELRSQLEHLLEASPPIGCVSCGAAASLAAGDVLAHPDSALSEKLQTSEFNLWETQTALLILARLMRTQGGMAYLQAPDGHRFPADSAADILHVLKALSPGETRWLAGQATADQLEELLRGGASVLLPLEGVHWVTVYEIQNGKVVYSQPMVDDGTPASVPVATMTAEFLSKWMGREKTGTVLLGMPAGKEIPAGMRLSESSQLADVLGCCGVSNASGQKGLFSLAMASRLAVWVLESRGFDNYASAYRFFLPLPSDFQPPAALKEAVEEAERLGREDIVWVKDDAGALRGIRFFAISRGVGSAKANAKRIQRDIQDRVTEVASLVYGRGHNTVENPITGDWHVQHRYNLVATFVLEAALDHTRYKTKGGDRQENAHFWPSGGIVLGHNGDAEPYEAFKAIFATKFHDRFEGTTDSEVLEHSIARLKTQRDPDTGRKISEGPLEVGVIRAFRLWENVEALSRASEVLQDSYPTNDREREHQRRVGKVLAEHRIPVEEVKETVRMMLGDRGLEIPVFVAKLIENAHVNPALMDQLVTSANQAPVYGYRRLLGDELKKATGLDRFANEKALNISINLASLYDSHNAVVARAYDGSTAFYFGFQRDSKGNVIKVIGASETRGMAPQIGIKKGDPVPIRPGVVNLINGEVEQLAVKPWSVYMVDGTQVTRIDVWSGEVESNLRGTLAPVKWAQPVPGAEAQLAELTAFRLETEAQPITLGLTLRSITIPDPLAGGHKLRLTSLSEQARAALENPETKILAGGSGTSLNALKLVAAAFLRETRGLSIIFDKVLSSDEWLSEFPEGLIRSEVAAGRPPVFLVVSQSGETGAAKKLINRARQAGAIVIGMTNRPGSSVYTLTQASALAGLEEGKGGALVTQSIDETAVAATGSNSSQIAEGNGFAMERRERAASPEFLEQIQEGHAVRIGKMMELTTDAHRRGGLQVVLDSFGPEGHNTPVVQRILAFVNPEGVAGDLREGQFPAAGFLNTSFILTGLGPQSFAGAPEGGLKIMEVTRKQTVTIRPSQLLAYGIGDADPFQKPHWDPKDAVSTIQENLNLFTTGLPDRSGDYPQFGIFPRNSPRSAKVLGEATSVLLLGDGEDLVGLGYLDNRYRAVSPVVINTMEYLEAPRNIRPGTLVVAVQPWTEEQAALLESFRKQGAHVVVVTHPHHARPFHPAVAQRASQTESLIETAGQEWEFAQVIAVDLLLMRLLEEKKVKNDQVDYTSPDFLRGEVEAIQKQISGVEQVVRSFKEQTHRNRVTLGRIINYARRRGWSFQSWSTGKGKLLTAAQDLHLRMTARTGIAMGYEETSQFKHGPFAATAYGDMIVNYWPAKGTPDWGDARKTVIDEVVPRVAQYPFPFFSEQEPGMILLIAADDPKDENLRHLSQSDYERLRELRKQSKDVDEVKRPDAVFVTPTGGFLESLTLNRIFSEEMGSALARDMEGRGGWEGLNRRSVVLLYDMGDRFPQRGALLDALRMRFQGKNSRVVAITSSVAAEALRPRVNDVLTVPTDEPIAFIVAGHMLTSQLVQARFSPAVDYLVKLHQMIEKDIEQGKDGVVGKTTARAGSRSYRTPGELLMGYGLGESDAERAVNGLKAEHEELGDLDQVLRAILELYNIDPFKSIGAAWSAPSLWQSLIDLIEKVAKVVTNFSGILVSNSSTEPFQFARWQWDAENLSQARVDPAISAQIAQDAEAVSQLRAALQDAFGPEALQEVLADNSNLVEIYVSRSFPIFQQVLQTVRDRIPGLPATIEVVLELRGQRLAHQADGRVVLNVNVVRNVRLVEEQIEHEALHEVSPSVLAGVAIPEIVPHLTGLPLERLRSVLVEAAILQIEAQRHFSYRPDEQHAVRQVLQGPNVVDQFGRFDRFLNDWRTAAQPHHQLLLTLDFIEATQTFPQIEVRALRALVEQRSEVLEVVQQMRALLRPQDLPAPAPIRSLPGPYGPVYGVYFSGNAQAIIDDAQSRDLPQRVAANIAGAFVSAGARGSIPVSPPGATSYQQMDAESLANLEAAASYVRSSYAPAVLTQSGTLVSIAVDVPQDERVGRVRFANGTVGWTLACECLKHLLAGPGGNYGAPLAPRETGSGVIMVIADSEAARWVIPSELESQKLYAAQLVARIPPEVQAAMPPEELQRQLSPITPIAGIEKQLDWLARVNGIPNDETGQPDLRRVQVSFLGGRARDKLVNTEYGRLHDTRGLQLLDPEDGTFSSAMSATLPPPGGGYTRQNPLKVSRTTGLLTQAVMMFLGVGGGAFPRGAAAAVQLLPPDLEAHVPQATPEEPIGGATDFSLKVADLVRKWLPNEADPLLAGRPLVHTMVKGKSQVLFVPTTSVGILGNPIPNREGVPGIEFDPLNQMTYHAIVSAGGNVFVESRKPQALLGPAPPFNPPLDIQITGEAEERSFLTQLEGWLRPFGVRLTAEIAGQFFEALRAFEQSGEPQVLVFFRRERALVLALDRDFSGIDVQVRSAAIAAGVQIPRFQTGGFRGVGVVSLYVTGERISEEATQEALRTGILRQLRSARLQGDPEDRFAQEMGPGGRGGRHPTVVEWLSGLYRAYRSAPGVHVSVQEGSGLTFFLAVFPHRVHTDEHITAVLSRELAALFRDRPVEIVQLYGRDFRETESSEVGVAYVGIRGEGASDPALHGVVLERIREVLEPFTEPQEPPPVQAGLEETTAVGGVAIMPQYIRRSPQVLMLWLNQAKDPAVLSQFDSAAEQILEEALQGATNYPLVVLEALQRNDVSLPPDWTVSREKQLASLFWQEVAKPALVSVAQGLIQRDPSRDARRIKLGLGFPVAASIDPNTGDVLLDVLALVSRSFAYLVIEDALRHLNFRDKVKELEVGEVSLSGSLYGQFPVREIPELIRRAIAEAVFLQAQAQRFSTFSPGQQASVVEKILSRKLPLEISRRYEKFLKSASSQSGQKNFSRERFWEALKVVADSASVYTADVSAMAEGLWWRKNSEKLEQKVWEPAESLILAIQLDSGLGTFTAKEPQTGLEEAAGSGSPLDLPLPDRWPAYREVIERLRQARDSSGFLRTVWSSLQRDVESIPPGYRSLHTAEILAMEENRVRAVDGWERVYVPVDFNQYDIKRMFNVRLYGWVTLGTLRGDAALGAGERPLESHIHNTTLRDVVLGDDVLMENNTLVERYVVGSRAIITHNRELTAERGTSFGLGVSIPVGPETGGREVRAYPEMLLGDVARLTRSRGDKDFQQEYAAEHARYVEAARSDFGFIGSAAVVSGVGNAKNLFLGDGVILADVPEAENVVALSEAARGTRLVGADRLYNAIIQTGVRVGSGAVVIGTSAENGALLLEHSHVENGAMVKDSVVAPNSGVERGELTSSLLGPFVGMHHSSLVIGVDWAEGMGNVGAEAAIGSNHTSRQPDQELRAGEGTFFGLNSSYSFSGNYTAAPYTIFAKGVSALPQRMQMPFSLIQKPTVQIPGLSPELMEISPNWVWSDNAYMPMRNEGKYASRDKAEKHLLGRDELQRYPYEILRPSVVNPMVRARDALAELSPGQAVDSGLKDGRGRPILYYTDKQIPGIGKNFMTEQARAKGVASYTEMIQYYALKGLLAEIQGLERRGQLGFQLLNPMDTPSGDLRWEHERRVLRTELPNITLADGLWKLADFQDDLARRVRESKEKDDERGERLLDDYGEAHSPASEDKFVKKMADEAAKLRLEVSRLTRLIGWTSAGLEEAASVGAAAGLLRTAPDVVPARLADLAGEAGGQAARDVRVGGNVYGPIFVDPTGLAVGVTLQFARTPDGRAMPQRFVVANEPQEQALLGVLAEERHSDIVRAWQYPGGVQEAVEAAEQDLMNRYGVLGWPVRALPTSLAGLMAEIRELAALLEAGNYDAEFAAKLAQRAYELFV